MNAQAYNCFFIEIYQYILKYTRSYMYMYGLLKTVYGRSKSISNTLFIKGSFSWKASATFLLHLKMKFIFPAPISKLNKHFVD